MSQRRGTTTAPPTATPGATAWRGHAWAARLVQVFVVVAPIAIGVVASFVIAHLLPTPRSTLARWAEIIAVAVVGVVVMRISRRATQRLLPLSSLLRLSVTFGDSTPSRMRVAMRVTSEARLRELAEETRVNGLPTEPTLVAERIMELVAALSYHDRITRGHAERVRAYCGLIATELHFDEHERERLQWAGLLHDIGKLGVPPAILNKPSRLTDEEFDVIKTHPGEGERLLEPVRPWLGDVVDAAGQHHERWDGKGYPRGLAGEDIVLSARIVSVADVFDVITSTRSYKEPASPANARTELASCAGTQFDERVVRAFLAVPLSRLRRAMGPLTLLAEIPAFAALPAIGNAAAAAAGALGAAAVVAAASIASVAPHSSTDPIGSLPAVVSPVAGDGGSAPGSGTSGTSGTSGAVVPDGAPGSSSADVDVVPGQPTADGVASSEPDGELGFVPADESGASPSASPGTTLPGSPPATTPDGRPVPTTTPRVTVPVTTPPVTTPGGTTPVTTPVTTPTVTVPTTVTTPTVTVPTTVTTPTVTVPTTVTTPTVTVPITTTTITVPVTTPTIPLPISLP